MGVCSGGENPQHVGIRTFFPIRRAESGTFSERGLNPQPEPSSRCFTCHADAPFVSSDAEPSFKGRPALVMGGLRGLPLLFSKASRGQREVIVMVYVTEPLLRM